TAGPWANLNCSESRRWKADLMCLQASCATPLPSTCPVAWRYLMRHVSLHPSSFALPQWLRPRSNGHKRMPRQNRLRPSPRSRRKICQRAMEEEGDASLDHLVGAGEECRWNGDAERPGRLQVDDELEFGRLQDRQVGGLRALEDLTGVGADLAPHVQTIGPIAHQQARFGPLTGRATRRNPVTRRERRKLDAPASEEPIAGNEEGIGPVACDSGEDRLDFPAVAGVEGLDLQSDGAGSFRYIPQHGFGDRSIGRIDQHGNASGFGHQLVQQPQPFGHHLGREKIDPRQVSARPGEAGDQTKLDRVVADAEDDRDRRGRGFGRERSLRETRGSNNGHAAADEVAMSDGKRSYWPLSQWYSTITFSPS